jgi:hypothetical protein
VAGGPNPQSLIPVASKQKTLYHATMNSIKILVLPVLFFIFLGAGCQDPTETIVNDYQNKLEKVDYLKCISAAQAEYDALTENNTKIPQQSWLDQKQIKFKDCEEKYGK